MRKNSDLILALFVVAITAMLLVPLPTALLDILLAANISFALLLLLVGLYMPNALALLAFPSLLLLTTLFRLSLNVASTRLILSQADAGTVIEAFGTFLIRGEIVVGVIIFLIVTIVNFIVIARGSSRVSEVAARFALDSLPGKQLAIDSDLRSGTISADQAQKRRDDLRKESQLYGSMDGAMKFVQGDAIAGLFIIATNIFGGIYIGISEGLSFSDAAHTYVTLTVGDGLVSQIPALLISICAGVLVTRVSSGENTTLGAEVESQIFRRPGALLFAGLLAILIATLPGMPAIPFVAVGGILIIAGGLIFRGQRLAGLPAVANLAALEAGGVSALALPSVEDRPTSSELILHLDSTTLFKIYKSNTQRYLEWWESLRNDFFNDWGVAIPSIRVIADSQCAPQHYAFSVGGSIAGKGKIYLDSLVVEIAPNQAPVYGIEVLQEINHPVSGERVFWTQNTAELKKLLDAGQVRSFDFFAYIGLEIATFFIKYPEELLTLTDVHLMLKTLEKKYPGLVAESFNREYVNLSRLTEVLQELLRQRLSIRDFKQVIESIAAYCSSFGSQLSVEDAFDVYDVVTFVRQGRKRHILSRLKSLRGTIKVFTISSEVEEVLAQAKLEKQDATLGLVMQDFESIRQGLEQVIKPIHQAGQAPVAVLTSSKLMSRAILFLRQCQLAVPVISYEEVDSTTKVELVASWCVV